MVRTINSRVRIYKPSEGGYTYADYQCSISRKHKAVPDITGIKYARECSVRIFTDGDAPAGDAPADIGCYMALGGSEQTTPDKSKCLKVLDIHDNRRGINPHWRLIANE